MTGKAARFGIDTRGPVAIGSNLGQTIDPSFGMKFGQFHVCTLLSDGAAALLGCELEPGKAVTVIRVHCPSSGYRFEWDGERLKLVKPERGGIVLHGFTECFAVFDRAVCLKEIEA